MNKCKIGIVFFFAVIIAIAGLCFYYSEQAKGLLLFALATTGFILIAYVLGQAVGWLASPRNKRL